MLALPNSVLNFDFATYTPIDDTLSLPVFSSSPIASSSSSESVPSLEPPSSSPLPTSISPNPSPTSTITSEPSPSNTMTLITSKHTSTAAAAGGAIGGVLLLSLLVVLMILYRRYKHRIRQRMFKSPLLADPQTRVDPFFAPPVHQPLAHYSDNLVDVPNKKEEKRTELQMVLSDETRRVPIEEGQESIVGIAV
ncbi:hypothetical protein BDP27DRAFT_173138 [Rhodocollybia butyracea]|uniref:Uncharacterized protein n=1 Tax=Rhodocollybia butyracea TaxID=206335 RepID=A0A9P5PKJ3_9AGAR|nr:hypothetical protein BDP27DRAFT_173138 [Rhodocollybia butyracea]